jgi:hypothetical protein
MIQLYAIALKIGNDTAAAPIRLGKWNVKGGMRKEK